MKIWDSSFELGDAVTDEQLAFFKKHGVIIFRNFLPKEQVSNYIAEQQRIEAQLLAEKKEKVNGIPLKFGKDDKGNTTIQRLCFSSLHIVFTNNVLQFFNKTGKCKGISGSQSFKKKTFPLSSCLLDGST